MSLPIVLRARRTFLGVHSLFVNQQRTNTREAIHRYVEPVKFKKHMLAASEPYIKRKYVQPGESCKGTTSPVIEMHPLDRILCNELVEELKQSEIVLFFQYNYTPFQSERVYINTIIKSGGKLHALKNQVYKEAFTILQMEHTHCLFNGRNGLITGQIDCLPRCVTALRKMPQFILLAGMINNHLYQFDQLKLFAASPSLDQSRANLLNTLTIPASEMYSHLEQHIKQLDSTDSEEKQ